jgi:hypothetical protein
VLLQFWVLECVEVGWVANVAEQRAVPILHTQTLKIKIELSPNRQKRADFNVMSASKNGPTLNK